MHENPPAGTRALAVSTCLNHTYRIEGVLGEGGFGITYIGRHLSTDQRVAIKEYFPSELATRAAHAGDNALHPFSGKEEDLFSKGRRHFCREAKILEEFQHIPCIVSIYDIFEENNTVYLVMEYIEGTTLEQYITDHGPMHFTELMPLITPVMQALSVIHEKKQIHRDISPDNLILGTDNNLHLIDFGAASPQDFSGHPKTVILKSGYAPPEQYMADSKTGAWTDVYALCATMYFALTGNPPSDAIHRVDETAPSPLSSLTDILPWQRDALEKGLQLYAAKRFRNISELYCALTVAPAQEAANTIMNPALGKKEKQKLRHMRYRQHIPLFALTAVMLFLGVAVGINAIKTISSKNKNKASSSPSGTVLRETPLPSTIPVPTSLFSEGHLHSVQLTDSLGEKPDADGTTDSTSVPTGKETPDSTSVPAGKETPDSASVPARKETPKAAQKTSSPDYQITPEEDDYVNIPFD